MSAEPFNDLPVVDLAEPDLWQDPAGALAPIREAAPLAQTARGELVVLRYAETESLLADSRMRTVGGRLLEGIGITEGPLADWWRRVMFNTNPPEHGRLRSLVSRAFTPRQTAALRPEIRRLANRMIDSMLSDSGDACDFEAGLADPLPIFVTCALLGVPESEHAAIRDQTAEIGKLFATRISQEQKDRCEQAYRELAGLLRELFAFRARKPKDDLLSALVAARDGGDSLSAEECEAMAINLLFAGHDTTRGLLSIGVAALLAHPHAVEQLRRAQLEEAAPAIGRAVEEMLRFEPPTLGSLRAAAEEIELPHLRIPAGRPIHFLFPGGNRDPRAFEHPDRFDAGRTGPRPLSFGLGSHFCLGAGLARIEAQEVVAALLDRTRQVEVAHPPRLVPFATIRRFESGLSLRLECR